MPGFWVAHQAGCGNFIELRVDVKTLQQELARAQRLQLISKTWNVGMVDHELWMEYQNG